MILYNSPDSSLNADFHFVPTVHVNAADGLAIKAYAATAGATASIAQATIVYNLPAPNTASFSSRGPLLAGNGDVLKPDLIAPGQDILAAVAPPGNAGRSFDLYSGTSMSSPHVAGLGALLKQAHPDWSPMAIKSALMTTGYDVLDGPNTNPLVIFRQGAGHVKPNSAVDPGLVYDSGRGDWLSFLCGVQPGSFCAALGITAIDPSDLNTPSIAIGDLAGTQTVKRTVTNVGKGKATYTASVSGLTGVTAAVSPASLTLNPGESKSFNVSFTRTSAAAQRLRRRPADLDRRLACRAQPHRHPLGRAGGPDRSLRFLQREVRLHRQLLGHPARPRARDRHPGHRRRRPDRRRLLR